MGLRQHCLHLLAYLVCLVPLSHGQLVALPPTPDLSPAGLQLIYDFEVGGGKVYYDRFLRHPEWPGASSGITVGVGYDLGYNSAAVIRQDWADADSVDRLATAAGITGSRARAILSAYRSITIDWPAANGVFTGVTLARFYALTERTYPGLRELRPNAQAALLSVVFNRGSSLVGGNRREMRDIKALVPRKDYAGMAGELRSMERIWRGTDVGPGLIRRREAEAKLMETP